MLLLLLLLLLELINIQFVVVIVICRFLKITSPNELLLSLLRKEEQNKFF